MFAGVRCGNFGEATSCESGSEEEAEKYCRVDMAWFYGVIQTLEKDFDVVYNTKVKFNSECFIHGDRIVNPYNHNYGQLDHREGYFKNSKIRFTGQVKFIRDNTSDWIPFEKLFYAFVKYNLNVPKDKLKGFLLSLIENGFLITDIRGGLSETDPLQNLLDQLKDLSLIHIFWKQKVSILWQRPLWNMLPGKGLRYLQLQSSSPCPEWEWKARLREIFTTREISG